ncbi:MAG: ABC transporter ATP-binding protein [Muribaculaceae bacterium]|nr:ABC transporter ATP-binding protein [Muribaculaceae bacterium]
MNNNSTISVSQLATGYTLRNGEQKIVTKPFDAVLNSGMLTCLLGRNGSGKSTLLRTLSAFQPPIGGDIFIGDKKLTTMTDAEKARTFGVVLTEKINAENLTVTELVGMGRSPFTNFWGTLNPHDISIVEKSLNIVGATPLATRRVTTLSDGERQKVMIAKALAQETPIILLDEPTAFLDYPGKVEIMLILRRLAREQGKTIFLSTHDLEVALQIADSIWLLDRSGGVTTGTPRQLADAGVINSFFDTDEIGFEPATLRFIIK